MSYLVLLGVDGVEDPPAGGDDGLDDEEEEEEEADDVEVDDPAAVSPLLPEPPDAPSPDGFFGELL